MSELPRYEDLRNQSHRVRLPAARAHDLLQELAGATNSVEVLGCQPRTVAITGVTLEGRFRDAQGVEWVSLELTLTRWLDPNTARWRSFDRPEADLRPLLCPG